MACLCFIGIHTCCAGATAKGSFAYFSFGCMYSFKHKIMYIHPMKRDLQLLIFSLIFAIPVAVKGQQNTLSCGGDISGAAGNVAYSIGQVVFNHVATENGSVNEGVQQPYSTDIITGAEVSTIQLALFPNPTKETAILKIRPEDLGLLNYSMFNSAGQQIGFQHLQNTETPIPVAGLANGIYVLNVDNGVEILKSFRIVKTE